MLVRREALVAFAFLLTLAWAPPASASPVVIPTSVADALQGKGQGLCVVNAVSTTPATDFPQQAGLFNDGINQFLLQTKPSWKQYVQRTIFDLSNNLDPPGVKLSWGDFTDSMTPQCQTGGCGFFVNDTTTSFASRFRGFLNVTSDLVNKPVHIGLYADDAVSLTFWDKSQVAHSVIIQPPVIGSPTWRTTQEVQFDEAGLYPLEILYCQFVESAALEMSFFVGDFTDFQYPANLVPDAGTNPSLKSVGFSLFQEAQFFQTLSGAPSFPNLDQCQQCDRQFVGQIGNNGCDSGYYCNEAALCAPCDTALLCGPSCSPCGGKTPFCINENGTEKCGQCRNDNDCKPGFTCNLTTHTCNECRTDADCPQGKECDQHNCVWCSAANKCAGNSCNCCGDGLNGKQMQCLSLASGDPPECVECTKDSDCTEGGVCDVLIGQCVPSLAAHESKNCCGAGCLQCPADNPLCLPGPFGTACEACRNDMECPSGNFCIEGECSPCTTARHCGTRCETCGGDTPFCNDAQLVKDAACVRCTDDTQCVGGACDQSTHECKPTCAMSCAAATPYCNGQTCVECYADTQCPCNGTCDTSTFTCSTSCKGNADCLGDQHCQHADDGSGNQSCSPGPLPDNVACGSTLANICSGSTIGTSGTRAASPAPASGVAAIGLLALLLRRKARGRAERRA
jgi:outer membrane exchange protein TraA